GRHATITTLAAPTGTMDISGTPPDDYLSHPPRVAPALGIRPRRDEGRLGGARPSWSSNHAQPKRWPSQDPLRSRTQGGARRQRPDLSSRVHREVQARVTARNTGEPERRWDVPIMVVAALPTTS